MCSMNTIPTDRQREVLGFLRSHRISTGQPPSTREVQRKFGFKSQNAVMNHLRALARKGLIEQPVGRVWVCREDLIEEESIALPVLGQIRAGTPTSAEQQADKAIRMNFDALGIRNAKSRKLFGLHVHGDSMINAHVMNGDLVILERKPAAPGDIVAALIDGETTLKRLIVEKRRTFLKAENENFPDLHPAESLAIQGVMIALIRNHLN